MGTFQRCIEAKTERKRITNSPRLPRRPTMRTLQLGAFSLALFAAAISAQDTPSAVQESISGGSPAHSDLTDKSWDKVPDNKKQKKNKKNKKKKKKKKKKK